MVDTSVVLGPASGYIYAYGAASNGDGWRACWAEEGDYSVRTSGIGPDGSLLDPQGIPAGHFDYMSSLQFNSIVGTGTGFVAVWARGDYGICGATLDSSGAVKDSFLVFESDSGQAMPAIAFDGDSTCLVVWIESPYGDCDILASRVTTSGRVLDPSPIPVADDPLENEQLPAVAYGRGVYLVAWTSDGPAGAVAARVSPGGAVLDTAIILRHDSLSYQAYPTVAFGDTCFLAAWAEGLDQPDMFAARVSASGTVMDTEAIRLASSPDMEMLAAIGFDGSNYLVLWHDLDSLSYSPSLCGRRVTTGGVALDSAVIRPHVTGRVCMYPSVAADQANFLVAFTAQDTMTYYSCVGCVRISPAGTVLDSGILLPVAADAQEGPSGTSDGTDFLAAWLESRSAGSIVSAARIAADGHVLDPSGFEVNDAPGQKTSIATGFGDSMYLVAWADSRGGNGPDIYCARVGRDGHVLDPGGIVVCDEVSDQDMPDISFDGQSFLIAWQDLRSGRYDNIYAARVSLAGVVLDPDGFVVAAADTFDDVQPAVCFNGAEHLVVWQGYDMNSAEQDVYGALVSPAGRVTRQRFVVNDAAGSQYTASVAAGPANSLVAWQDERSFPAAIYAARVRTDGTVLDPDGIRVDSSEYYYDQLPRVSATTAGYKVLWSRNAYTDTTYYAVAEIDTGGNVVSKGDWFALPGSDNGYDAVYGSGPDLLVLFSCWTDTAMGRDYEAYRLWGRLDVVPGIEEGPKPQSTSFRFGPTIVRSVLNLPAAAFSLHYSLFSLAGQKVMDLHVGANDVRSLAPGVYFVQAAGREQSAVSRQKVIVTR
jgi:hypothetical protein